MLTGLLGFQELRAAQAQEQATLLQHAHSIPAQEHPSPLNATHSHDQFPIGTLPAGDLPVTPISYGNTPLHDIPFHNVPFHNTSFHNAPFHDMPIDDVFGGICSSNPSGSNMPIDYEGPAEMSYGWNNWTDDYVDGDMHRPTSEPSFGDQYIGK